MTAAIFGLLGVLIGGGLNILGGYVADSRAQKRELRTAARLLLPELIDAYRTLRGAKQADRFPSGGFSHSQWDEHQATLARLLDSATWDSVTEVYTSLSLIEDERSDLDEESAPELTLSEGTLQEEREAKQAYLEEVVTLGEDDRDYLDLTLYVLDDLLRKLAAIAGARPPQDRLDGLDS